MIEYVGNSAYCYANSLNMCLRAAGMTPQFESGFLECLTLMPFGTMLFKHDATFLPGGPNTHPDNGLDVALEAIGWTADSSHGDSATVALRRLREAVQSGPALLGPLDMFHLTHHPFHANLSGVDHFVAVLEVTDTHIRLHDPDHYPFATLPIDDFMQSWKAAAVGYGDRPYKMRTNFRPLQTRSRPAIIQWILPQVFANLTCVTENDFFIAGPETLRRFAAALRAGEYAMRQEFLTGFALPLGARRYMDGARFLQEAGHARATELMSQKAHFLGEALYPAVHQQWELIAAIVEKIIPIEDELVRVTQ